MRGPKMEDKTAPTPKIQEPGNKLEGNQAIKVLEGGEFRQQEA